MRRATNIGVISAMLLILTLIIGALNVVAPSAMLPPAGATLAILGLALVVLAASLVLYENKLMQRALDDELSDVKLTDEASGPAEGS